MIIRHYEVRLICLV